MLYYAEFVKFFHNFEGYEMHKEDNREKLFVSLVFLGLAIVCGVLVSVIVMWIKVAFWGFQLYHRRPYPLLKGRSIVAFYLCL